MAPRRNIDSVLKQAKIHHLIDAIVAVEDIERLKPDPEVFLKAAAELGISPADCVAIEDAAAGVAAAVAAGMVTIALTTTLPADKLGHAHHIVNNLDDLNRVMLQDIYNKVRQTS